MKRTRVILISAQVLAGAMLFCAGADNASARPAIGLKPCSLSSVEVLAECISTQRSDTFSYDELVDEATRVLVFGETHLADAHRHEVICALPSLKKLGFSHLALEAMPSSRQNLVAEYKAGRLSSAELAAEIKSIWGHSPMSYVRLIDVALAENIDVVFMDSDREPIDMMAPNWQELEREARERREEHWMNVLSGILRSYDSNVIVLVGSGHNSTSAKTTPVSARLSALNIKSTAIAFEGGDRFFDSVLAEAARNAQVEDTRFVVRVEPEVDAEGDYHLHLSQTGSRIINKRH